VRRDHLQVDQRVVISLSERGRRLPEESATSAEKSNPVGTDLRDIPAVERRALLQAMFSGYGAQDISEADGIPPSEARNRLRSGLTKLRGLLSQVEPVNSITGRPASSPLQG
jgi:DNA-directed RNA polymerase specialized sigma24 family protein